MSQALKRKLRWTDAYKQYLLYMVFSYKAKNKKPDWQKMQEYFPGLTAYNLQVQFNNLKTRGYLKKHVFKGESSEQESQLLCSYLIQLILESYKTS